MSARATIRQDDLARIFRASKAAAYPVSVKIEPTGTVVILPIADKDAPKENPWDDSDG